jgi:hypothetical protein
MASSVTKGFFSDRSTYTRLLLVGRANLFKALRTKVPTSPNPLGFHLRGEEKPQTQNQDERDFQIFRQERERSGLRDILYFFLFQPATARMRTFVGHPHLVQSTITVPPMARSRGMPRVMQCAFGGLDPSWTDGAPSSWGVSVGGS